MARNKPCYNVFNVYEVIKALRYSVKKEGHELARPKTLGKMKKKKNSREGKLEKMQSRRQKNNGVAKRQRRFIAME